MAVEDDFWLPFHTTAARSVAGSGPDISPELVGDSDSEGKELRQCINFTEARAGQSLAVNLGLTNQLRGSIQSGLCRSDPQYRAALDASLKNAISYYYSKITPMPDDMLKACESETSKVYQHNSEIKIDRIIVHFHSGA
jgi:hypothetical protein